MSTSANAGTGIRGERAERDTVMTSARISHDVHCSDFVAPALILLALDHHQDMATKYQSLAARSTGLDFISAIQDLYVSPQAREGTRSIFFGSHMRATFCPWTVVGADCRMGNSPKTNALEPMRAKRGPSARPGCSDVYVVAATWRVAPGAGAWMAERKADPAISQQAARGICGHAKYMVEPSVLDDFEPTILILWASAAQELRRIGPFIDYTPLDITALLR